MLVAPTREAAVTYKKELDKLNGPSSKIIMTSNLGERGKDGTSWDPYYLTTEQREAESERFKDSENHTQMLIVIDMLLVGYDAPVVQVLYLDHGLREHSLLQAIARVNRPYDKNKTYGLIVDYCGITKELQKALAIFDQEDIQGALESIDKELKELKIRHAEAMSFFNDVDRNDDSAVVVKFEPVNVRDEFEYAYKMFSKSLDIVLPRKEAGPYIDDFKYVSKIRNMLRTSYEGIGISLRTEGKKVQQLIDDYVRALDIAKLIPLREITYENFLGYVAKFKSERARTALIKNKARQVISELAFHNPVYYQKLRERLEKLIEEEEKRRKQNADYFNKYKEIYQEALGEDKKRKELGFSTKFEFAVYNELLEICKQEKMAKATTLLIFKHIKSEINLVGWKQKTSSKKNMSMSIYDVLSSKKFPEDKLDELTDQILILAENNLP